MYQGANEYAPPSLSAFQQALWRLGNFQGPSQATNLRDSLGSQLSPPLQGLFASPGAHGLRRETALQPEVRIHQGSGEVVLSKMRARGSVGRLSLQKSGAPYLIDG